MNSDTNKNLSILIPNYNGRNLLERFLPYTFIAAKNSRIPFEIIIVDDASIDDSVFFIQSNYPEIVLRINDINKGFSETCNIGIQLAKNNLLFILNSDIQLSPYYFNNQLKYFDLSSTFGVMSKIEDNSKPNHTERSQTLFRFGFKTKRQDIICSYAKDELYPTVFLSGANALIDLEKMKILGGFNKLFSPYYYEDIELSIRAWRLGWKCYFDNFSSCLHLHCSTIKNSAKRRQIKTVYYRNKFILHSLHLTYLQTILFDLQILFLVILPRIFLGRFWIVISYINYLKQKKDIQYSKEQFKILMQKHKSTITIFDIKRIIRKLQPN